MNWEIFLTQYSEAAKTSIGFFWKAGWAFVFGYSISAMIQSFVPKSKLAPRLGSVSFRSVGEATIFGAISSSCSFAALSAARSLISKGAHFVAGVAFMFASTNLVIELGILILVFLGWQYLVAELVGGLLLILVSSLLIKWTYPEAWFEAARNKLENSSQQDKEKDIDWKKRVKSWEGWRLVGQRFVMEWRMVWQEILIGFTIAGFVAVFIPDTFWKAVFLNDFIQSEDASFWIVLENTLVAPFVAAFTFIGSMGNIPLATVLNSGGVLFAGIMGFIYSDLMVPPLVKVNAKYYGWRVALYIAGIMYVSIIATALALHYIFFILGITPESSRKIAHVAQFSFDYTFYLNIGALGIVAFMIMLSSWSSSKQDEHTEHHNKNQHQHEADSHSRNWVPDIQSALAILCIVMLVTGALIYILI